jgi:integrase
MSLTDTEVRQIKCNGVARKVADEKGLYLLVTPSGSKLWKLKYHFNGKEKKLSLGQYPDVSLKAARLKRDAARSEIAEGIDPSQEKKSQRVAAKIGDATTFRAVADEYIDKCKAEGKADVTLKKLTWLLSKLGRDFGKRPIDEITPMELLGALKRVESKGHRETARRMRSFAGRVFRYAVATGRATADPAQPLRGALIAPVVKHHAAIVEPAALGHLLRSIESYGGRPSTILALRISPHIFQRPGEIRKAEWSEIDLERAVWAIPAKRMKERQAHHVPLSKQALNILAEARELSGGGRYVFPAMGSGRMPLSENTINQALRRLGFSGDVMTAHGFRTTATSLLNEDGRWNPDAIERALSHAERNSVRAAYLRSTFWDERVRMAQWWSDKLEALQAGSTIIEFPSPSIAR